MKYYLKYIGISIFLVLIGAFFFYSHLFYTMTVSLSSFERHGENIYIDDQLKIFERKAYLSLLNEAIDRIDVHFGEYSASPTIVVVSGDEKAAKYGLGNVPGITYIAPWGQYVVVNADIANIDVLAHELLHAEVVERLGYWAWQVKFPVWLNEGLAMQVDNRPKYSLGGERISYQKFSYIITHIKTSDFWTNNKAKNIEHYRLSKAAVAELLKNDKAQSMYSMLSSIRKGENPNIAFDVEKTKAMLISEK